MGNTNLALDSAVTAAYRHGMSALEIHRKNKGLSQERLAELVGTSQPQIWRLENDEREMTDEWAVRLARALKVRPTVIKPDFGAGFLGALSPENQAKARDYVELLFLAEENRTP